MRLILPRPRKVKSETSGARNGLKFKLPVNESLDSGATKRDNQNNNLKENSLNLNCSCVEFLSKPSTGKLLLRPELELVLNKEEKLDQKFLGLSLKTFISISQSS